MIRFQLFGVPIEIGLYFWIGSALLGQSAARGEHAVFNLIVWVACVLLSIVVHELGHALVARRYGVRPTILLHGIGGLTFMNGARLTGPQSILVSLAGPAAGLGLWLVTRLIAPLALGRLSFDEGVGLAGYGVYQAIENLLFINLYWTLFNLLPILPLDGGQVLRELVGGSRLQITRAIGASCAAGVAVFEAMQGQFYIAIFLGILAYSNYRGGTGAIPGGVQRN